jgi:hypothetical protein
VQIRHPVNVANVQGCSTDQDTALRLINLFSGGA